MRSLPATITERSQVTLPAAVRRVLGVGPKDRVVFQIADDDTVTVVPVSFTLESVFGSVPAMTPPLETEEQLNQAIRDAKADKADREFEQPHGLS